MSRVRLAVAAVGAVVALGACSGGGGGSRPSTPATAAHSAEGNYRTDDEADKAVADLADIDRKAFRDACTAINANPQGALALLGAALPTDGNGYTREQIVGAVVRWCFDHA